MSYETLKVDKTPAGIALVWLNRPDVRNAFNETMIAEITAAFRALDADADVRAIILAGQGKAFCAGADLNWMKKMSGYTFEQNHDDALGARQHAAHDPRREEADARARARRGVRRRHGARRRVRHRDRRRRAPSSASRK